MAFDPEQPPNERDPRALQAAARHFLRHGLFALLIAFVLACLHILQPEGLQLSGWSGFVSRVVICLALITGTGSLGAHWHYEGLLRKLKRQD